MKRENGEIELTRDEVTKLWKRLYGETPEEAGVGLQTAAQAVLMTIGVERIQEALSE